MPTRTTFLAGATSKIELEACLPPPANRPPTYLTKIFDRAYLEPIWKFQRERASRTCTVRAVNQVAWC